jgi:hypothetical protein
LGVYNSSPGTARKLSVVFVRFRAPLQCMLKKFACKLTPILVSRVAKRYGVLEDEIGTRCKRSASGKKQEQRFLYRF